LTIWATELANTSFPLVLESTNTLELCPWTRRHHLWYNR